MHRLLNRFKHPGPCRRRPGRRRPSLGRRLKRMSAITLAAPSLLSEGL